MLIIADCRRRVEFEFSLGTARHRRESIAKAELLTRVLRDFTEALKVEANLVDSFQKPQKTRR